MALPFAILAQPPAPSAPAPQAPAPANASNPVPANLSPGVAEVIRLSESGVGEDVVMAYVQNSAAPFNLSADQVLYLRDVGLTSQVITAMLTRDTTLKNQPTPSAPGAPPPTAPPVTEPAPVPTQPTVPVEAPLTPPPATEVVNPPAQVNYFYSDLRPYGTWVDLEGVGWCWQPSVVVINRGWRPYCDSGHWVYTDCGWYWQSDYSWGWAAFHYGRWHLHPRCGWVWAPDVVWGPAWVIWRSYGDHCGWAPLPPHAVFTAGVGWRFNGLHVGIDFDFGLHAEHFTFVSFHDFNERDLYHRRMAPVEVTKIYNRTTIINNYTVNNNVVVNRGIAVDKVAAVARTPVRHAEVREAPAGANRPVAAGRGVEKGTPVIYRPQLRAPSHTAAVSVQKVDERHPVIQHTPNLPVAPAPKSGVEARSNPSGTTPRSTVERGVRTPAQGSGNPHVTPPRVQETPARPAQPQPRNNDAPRRNPPPAQHNTSAAIAPSAPTATQPSQDYKQPGRATPTYRTESNPAAFPLQSGTARSHESQAEYRAPRAPEAAPGNPHVYYPKSAQQGAEMRAAPPASTRSSTGGNAGNAHSKKND